MRSYSKNMDRPSALPGSLPAQAPYPPRSPVFSPAVARPAQGGLADTGPFNIVWLVAALLIFNHFGRPFETILVGLKIPAIVCGIGIFVAIIGGGVKYLNTTIGRSVCALVLWMAFVTPFSTWRGGSANYIFWYLSLWVVLMLVVAAAPRGVRDIARLGYVTAAACLFHLILNGGSDSGGRYALKGTFGNSDDVALLAGYAIPFVILFAQQRRSAVLRLTVLSLGVGFLIVLIGRTGTRAAIPALIIMIVVYFKYSTAAGRMGIALFTALALLLTIAVLPRETLSRFGTIVDSFEINSIGQNGQTSEAMASTAERHDLIMDALQMTRSNPLFGVGPGEFPDYRFKYLRYSNGAPKHYFPSHNTYLQIASETGIPGVIIYVFFLWSLYRTIRRTHKLNAISNHPDSRFIGQICVALQAAFVYFAACAVFMTCDRHPHQFVLAGMAIALERLLKAWNQQNTNAAPARAAVQPYAANAFSPRPAGVMSPTATRR